MTAEPIDKSKPPSHHITVGSARTPHRSYGDAVSLTVEQFMNAVVGGGLLREDCLAVSGTINKTDCHEFKFDTNQRVVYSISNPISAMGGVVGLKGSLAPEGAIVKVAGMSKVQFKGFARCIGREDDAFAAVDAGVNKDGQMLVIRCEGPEAAVGAPRALVQDGGIIAIDADVGALDLEVGAKDLGKRRKAWQARPIRTRALFSGHMQTRWARPSKVPSLTLAERLKLLATLTSKSARAIVLAGALVLAAGAGPVAAQGVPPQSRGIPFTSPEAALEQGLGAYRAGFYQMALPALEFAAANKVFLGQYYLARLFADNGSAMTNHGRAYRLFLGIVEEHSASIDVDDDERAPFVGKALTAVALYMHRGLPEIQLLPNATRAAEFLEEAATFFREPDGQFELAKLYLKGDGVPEDRRKALHWLSALTHEGHAGAQAFFADLLWSGKVVAKDEKKALALITVAVENAPSHERIWIEDIYQKIFCGSVTGVRQQADGLVASFRRLYAPRSGVDASDRMGAGLAPTRACGNGEPLPLPVREGRLPQNGDAARASSAAPAPLQNGVLGVRGPTDSRR